MYYAALPHRIVLRVTGADADGFLQGLISNDLRKLAPGALMYAAMLTPQGKFLHDFFLARHGDALLLDCDRARADDLMKRLTLYKLRADVKIERTEETVSVVWKNNSLPLEGEGQGGGVVTRDISTDAPLPTSPLKGGGEIFADPRLEAMGYRLYGAVDASGWQPVDAAAYEQHRIALGVPDGAQDMIADKSFLLEFGFEQLHGVDFNKGCYVGQEVTARSKFRGQVRKHVYQVKTDGELPPAGTKILQDSKEVGELRSHSGNIGLAILRIEAVEAAAPLTANGQTIAASFPTWVQHAAA